MAETVPDKSSDELALGSDSAFMDLVKAIHKLNLQDKARLLEYLSRSIQQGVKQLAHKDTSWEEFIDQSFGSPPEFRLDREQRGDQEVV